MTGCRFIEGDARAIAKIGDAIYCNAPVVNVGGSWCERHYRVCFASRFPDDEEGGMPQTVVK